MPSTRSHSLPDTITARIAALEAADGDATALVLLKPDGEERLSRSGFSALAGRCAAHLKAAGVGRGDVCILFFDHQPLCYAMFFGTMAVGAVPSFMPTITAKQEPRAFWSAHRELLALIGPGAIFASRADIAGLAEGLPGQASLLCAYEDIAPPAQGETPAPEASGIALLQHSSGTTGLKKGVALSHRAVLAHTDAYAKAITLSSDDVVVSWLPVYHDMGLAACLLLPLITGTPAVLMDRMAWLARPVQLFRAIERHRGTLCWMPNFAFAHLARLCAGPPAHDLSTMRLFVNCSEPCRPSTAEQFTDAFSGWGLRPDAMATCYAMAETVFAVSQSSSGSKPASLPAEDHPATLSSGKVLDGLSVELRGPDGHPVGAGQQGEIWVRGAWLFDGYYKRDALTQARVEGGWYRTGDLAAMGEDGSLFVLGRTDDLLIIDGRNFYAHEIEDCLSAIPGLSAGRTLALALEDERAGTRKLTILAERSGDGPPDPELKKAIRRQVNQRFALHPSDILLLDRGQLHKTTSGKIARQQNLAAYIEGRFQNESTAA